MLNKNTKWSTDGIVMCNGCNARVTIKGSFGERFSLETILENDYDKDFKQFNEEKIELSETAKMFVESANLNIN